MTSSSSILTRRRRPPAPQNNGALASADPGADAFPDQPGLRHDPAAARLQQLNQVEAALAHAARLLEQAQPEDYIPDYDQSRKQTLQELDKTRRTLGTKIYRLQTCRQVQAGGQDGSNAAAPSPEPSAAAGAAASFLPMEQPLRDCQS